jgi:hypothetical protein
MKYFVWLPVLFLTSCFQENTKVIYEIKNESIHPSGMKQKAVLSILPGEWNVGDRCYVHILSDKEDVNGNDYGMVFAVNNYDSALPRDSSKIRVKWLSDNTLKITYDKKLKILHQVIKTRDNVIVYEALDSPVQNP